MCGDIAMERPHGEKMKKIDVNNNWERIEEFCKMLGGRDDIFYGTNAQCLGYI